MSPNIGILFSGVLIPKLLNNPFAFCSFINLDFLLPHTTHFGDSINLPFLVFSSFESIFFVFLWHFKQICQHVCFITLLTTFLLCFCFRNIDLLEKHSAHLDLSLSTLFVIAIFFSQHFLCVLYKLSNKFSFL